MAFPVPLNYPVGASAAEDISIFGKKSEVYLSSLSASLLRLLSWSSFLWGWLSETRQWAGFWGGIGFVHRRGSLKAVLLVFLPKMRLHGKDDVQQRDLGIPTAGTGQEHLEIKCSWIPNEPNFPKGSFSVRVVRASSQSVLALNYFQHLR